MAFFIIKRIGISILLVFVVLALTFLAVRAVPGDPALMLAGGESGMNVSAAVVERIRTELGLDRPILVQLSSFVGNVLVGDFGRSFANGAPVSELIARRLPNSLELIVWASLLAVGIGISMGAWAARRRGPADMAVSVYSSFGIAVPSFVLGAVLVMIFALQLRWFPAGGRREWTVGLWPHMQSIILPAITLSVSFMAVVARMTRASVVETMSQDWVRTAVAIGLPRRKVFRRHVLRNALTPISTVVALEISTLFGATVMVERVFNYPGLSSLLVDAVQGRDYPVVQGVVIVVSVIFIFTNLLVDIFYGVLDPRASEA